MQQLFGSNSGDSYWSNVITGAETVSCVQDSKTGDVILKLANVTDSVVSTTSNLAKLGRLGKKATLTVLTGNKDMENGKGERRDTDIRPTTQTIRVSKTVKYDMLPYSFTVIRINRK